MKSRLSLVVHKCGCTLGLSLCPVPLPAPQLCSSPLTQALIAELQPEQSLTASDLDRLNLSCQPFLEKNIHSLIEVGRTARHSPRPCRCLNPLQGQVEPGTGTVRDCAMGFYRTAPPSILLLPHLPHSEHAPTLLLLLSSPFLPPHLLPVTQCTIQHALNIGIAPPFLRGKERSVYGEL